jgi:hypothetical protein
MFSLAGDQILNAKLFLQLFQSIFAKELNRLYGREGHFLSSRARVEKIIFESRAQPLLGYGACNVVKDGPLCPGVQITVQNNDAIKSFQS